MNGSEEPTIHSLLSIGNCIVLVRALLLHGAMGECETNFSTAKVAPGFQAARLGGEFYDGVWETFLLFGFPRRSADQEVHTRVCYSGIGSSSGPVLFR